MVPDDPDLLFYPATNCLSKKISALLIDNKTKIFIENKTQSNPRWSGMIGRELWGFWKVSENLGSSNTYKNSR